MRRECVARWKRASRWERGGREGNKIGEGD